MLPIAKLLWSLLLLDNVEVRELCVFENSVLLQLIFTISYSGPQTKIFRMLWQALG